MLESISLQFAAAPEQETDQAETIQLETRGAQNDDEDSFQRADEEFVRGTVDRLASFFVPVSIYLLGPGPRMEITVRDLYVHGSWRCVYYHTMDSHAKLAQVFIGP